MGAEAQHTPQFECAAIFGVGLLGSSLGLALKARGLAATVVGVGRRRESLEVALRRGAIDKAELDLAPAVRDADLVVLATPASLVLEKLDAVREACKGDAVVTDVASTKEAICSHATATWPSPRRFIGSHPMAGSEQFGPEHGRADFYESSVCLVEQGEGLDPAARDIVVALWEAVGASVVDIGPAAHDALLARTSHLPHILSAAIAELAIRRGDIRQFVGNGFRDMTRIAAGRPEIWRDICLTNRAAILDALKEFHEHLDSFAAALAREDAGAVEAWFRDGQAARLQAVPETTEAVEPGNARGAEGKP